MVPFVIGGIQMRVTHGSDNVPAMRDNLNTLMVRFPWVQMVVFSELAPFGTGLANAQTPGGPAEAAFREMAVRHKLCGIL